MFKACAYPLLFFCSSAALAQPLETDVSSRAFGGPLLTERGLPVTVTVALVNIADAQRIGARWGVVTSTHRTPEHNRRVGGVPNSYHLSGRAIDIARRPGVTHNQIAAALRQAGFHLLESLDEGDHSHFAFGSRGITTESTGDRLASAKPARPVPLFRTMEDERAGELVPLPATYGSAPAQVSHAVAQEKTATAESPHRNLNGPVLTLATIAGAGEAPRN